MNSRQELEVGQIRFILSIFAITVSIVAYYLVVRLLIFHIYLHFKGLTTYDHILLQRSKVHPKSQLSLAVPNKSDLKEIGAGGVSDESKDHINYAAEVQERQKELTTIPQRGFTPVLEPSQNSARLSRRKLDVEEKNRLATKQGDSTNSLHQIDFPEAKDTTDKKSKPESQSKHDDNQTTPSGGGFNPEPKQSQSPPPLPGKSPKATILPPIGPSAVHSGSNLAGAKRRIIGTQALYNSSTSDRQNQTTQQVVDQLRLEFQASVAREEEENEL